MFAAITLIGLFCCSPPGPSHVLTDSKIRLLKQTETENNEISHILYNVTENGDISVLTLVTHLLQFAAKGGHTGIIPSITER